MRPALSLLFASILFLPPTALAQEAQPRSGEGAFGLLQRNGIQPDNVVLAEFREMNSGKFTGDGGLKEGVSYALPRMVVEEPLFGDAYRVVNIESNRLAGTVWYLIGGHGGDDHGATGTYKGRTIYEDEIAYDTMLRFARLLRANGGTVYFITQDDDGIRDDVYLPADHDERNSDGSYVGNGRRERLHTRTDLINRYARQHGTAYQRVVEFHVDNYYASHRIDPSFYYWSVTGERLARRLRETMRNKYQAAQPGRGYFGTVRKEPFHTLKNARPVVAYIELGNIKNPIDLERLVQPQKRQTIAEWLFEGFLADVDANRR